MKFTTGLITLLALAVTSSTTRAAEGDDGDDHAHHKCACEAEELGFSIDCDNVPAMQAALGQLQLLGCASNCDSDECALNYFIVQAHHDYCPETIVPEDIEDSFHDYDSTCEACEISRKIIEGAPPCPLAVCDDNSGNTAYTAAIDAGCREDCSSQTCIDNYQILRAVHDNCPHEALTQEAEEGIHDLEGPCLANNCNSGTDTNLECDEDDEEGEGEGETTDAGLAASGLSAAAAAASMAFLFA